MVRALELRFVSGAAKLTEMRGSDILLVSNQTNEEH